MERKRYGGEIVPSESTNGVAASRSSSSFLQPNYNSKAVQDAIWHLASIDLIELCNEAKVEQCRATRDLRSCGRPVKSVLNSCGHASLCGECSQRYDTCPICRIPLPKSGNRLRLRLYYECVEAGLISQACENNVQERASDEAHLAADVQRLYSLFDVAMESNLCCLICQYVTDVCMDESAVSSDPVIAFLLDEVVVKDWCKQTFQRIITELRGIYTLEVDEMKGKMHSLLKFSGKLSGLSNVLEVLELSFNGAHSTKLDDLHHLQEGILKTKQHMEMMMWCIRHKFLEDVRSRYSDLSSWRKLVRERKSAAIQRAWPESVDYSMEPVRPDSSTLFIEDALLNLETEKGHDQERVVELEIASLQKDGGSSFFRSKIEGLAGFYPFENLRAAVDILFLYGRSDMVIAKQAIFLYYLFDRNWTVPDENWRHILDDFAATFSITKHSLLESFTFYLLDDHTDEALKEACHLLLEISRPDSHPKIAKVLLERQNPDAALMFLRWCGKDGGAELVSLGEAVSAVRVRMECGLLTEAFMYQRTLCTRIKEKKVKHQAPVVSSDSLKAEFSPWMGWVDVLVTEICCLCIRRNLVDRMIELPWNSDEQKHLHKCLLDYAIDNPSTTVGSLLVVFYLQRYRYVDAYHVDQKLQTVEQDFISKNNLSGENLHSMRSASQWRAGLINKSMELLPEVMRQQLKARKLPNSTVLQYNEVGSPREANIPEPQAGDATMLSIPSSPDSSILLGLGHKDSSFISSSSRSSKLAGSLSSSSSPFQFGKFSSPDNFPKLAESESKLKFGIVKNFKFDDIMTPSRSKINSTDTLEVKAIERTSSRDLKDDLRNVLLDDISPGAEENGVDKRYPKITPPFSRRVMDKPSRALSSDHGLLNDLTQERYATESSKRRSSGHPDRPWSMVSSVEPIEISWSHEENPAAAAERLNFDGRPRWKSGDTSEEDEQQSPSRIVRVASRRTLMKGTRRALEGVGGVLEILVVHDYVKKMEEMGVDFLADERSKAQFDVETMKIVWAGGKYEFDVSDRMARLVDTDPAFRKDNRATLDRKELFKNSLRKASHAWKRILELGLSKEEALKLRFFVDETTYMDLHWGMFIPAIKGQGTEEQQQKWLPMAYKMQIIGCYAQTELGHGSNIQGLETTATFDPLREEFVINSPTLTSSKWWPGGLSKVSTHAVIYARLITDGQDHGVNGFIVQLRSLDDHLPLPGITIGDIGTKFGNGGYNTVDNGFLLFDHVRIPRNQMLMRVLKVTKEGKVVQSGIPRQLLYGTMVYMRQAVVYEASCALSRAVCIATRYSAVRRQFGSQNGCETQVIDYRTQQSRLFPLLASAYAFRFVGDWLKWLYSDVKQRLLANDFSTLPEAHACTAGLKSLTTSFTADAIEECRKLCGGHGYLCSSGLPELFSVYVPACTYEGDNIVLLLQVARFLNKTVSQLGSGKQPVGMAAYMARVEHLLQCRCDVQRAEDWLKPNVVIEVFEARSARMSVACDRSLSKFSNLEDGFLELSVDLVNAAVAHCQLIVVSKFIEKLQQDIPGKGVKQQLETLCSIYALYLLKKHLGDFLSTGCITSKQGSLANDILTSLYSQVRPNAIALVDAFNYTDHFLGSVLGRYDGNVYPNSTGGVERPLE
ncbi:hypothetical protein Nepgr_028495 [Nepenthes gracilis]|uniref:acyl-CoA oxidase n=1 Tax=Nepenthes gracilis TaxID=150966 RepID=A0AAD3Y265_NEPGR|nr:hypothetical protein Nepgr_028495 [Nepenthes gracilis]